MISFRRGLRRIRRMRERHDKDAVTAIDDRHPSAPISVDEFQTRLLAALEAPKQNRFLAVINSSCFLWLLTALFITAGGTYFAKYQECAREADQISDKFQRLNEELYLRRSAVFQAISEGTYMDSIRTGVKDLPSLSCPTPAPASSDLSQRAISKFSFASGTFPNANSWSIHHVHSCHRLLV